MFGKPNSNMYNSTTRRIEKRFKTMYICLCKGITEEQLQEAVSKSNSRTSKEVLKRLGIGSDCGSCLSDAISQLQTGLKQNKEEPGPKK